MSCLASPIKTLQHFSDQILALETSTTHYVPDGVGHALATLKGEICKDIRTANAGGDTLAEVRCWKALLAVDALIFFDVKGGENVSRRMCVADRLRSLEAGRWGTLWAHAESYCWSEGDQDTPELERCVGKVTKLL